MESKSSTLSRRLELVSKIAEGEIKASAEDIVALCELIPELAQPQFSTILEKAKLVQSLQNEPVPILYPGWSRHAFGVARLRGDKLQAINIEEVNRLADLETTIFDSEFARMALTESEEARITKTIEPSDLRVSVSPRQMLASDLVLSLTRALPIVAVLLAVTGIWIFLRDLRREIDVAQLKSSFIDVVSHELRTPLTVVALKTEMLASGVVPRKRSKPMRKKLTPKLAS